MLSETDWYVVRKQETGESIPQDVLDERQSIRSQSETMESEISTLTTKEEVKGYQMNYN
ncbi:MAG: phage tail assembly chaperone [Halanaerobiales bacterium]|nr:phage tail assembly chaperone [Halanaerobiales bacterium]